MNYKVEVKEVKAQPALVIKGKAKVENVGQEIGRILGEVSGYLDKKKIRPTGAPFTRTFKFENGTMEFESGFPVATAIAAQGTIVATELPKGLTATTAHVGSPETSELAYKAVHEWIAKNGRKEAGAPWEIYLTDPSTTPENNSKIQIFFPVQ